MGLAPLVVAGSDAASWGTDVPIAGPTVVVCTFPSLLFSRIVQQAVLCYN